MEYSLEIKNEAEYKVKAIHLLPIFLNILSALAYTFLIINSGIEFEYLPIFNEVPEYTNPTEALLNPKPYLNAALFIILLTSGLFLNYFLIKKNLRKILKFLFLISFSILIYSILFFYIFILNFVINNSIISSVSFFLTFPLSIIIIKIFYSKKDLLRLLAAISIGSGAGSALGFFIPYWTSILILIFASIYDIIAVFKGPLKKIFEKDIDLTIFRFSLINFKGLIIGLGDIVFYSLLISFSFINFGLISAIAASIGIIIGSCITLSLLKKDYPFPGLPMPIFIGLTLACLSLIF
jgi:presenilin-like A22 family membrane protease